MRLRSLTTFALAASAMVTAFACSADSPAAPKSTVAPTEAPRSDQYRVDHLLMASMVEPGSRALVFRI